MTSLFALIYRDLPLFIVNPEVIKPPSNRPTIIVAIIIFIESVVSNSREPSRVFASVADLTLSHQSRRERAR